MVTDRGGTGIWKQVDHTVPEQVEALFAAVEEEQDGRLDILVNDVWGGDALVDWSAPPFWEHSLENGLLMLQRGLHSHLITSRYGAPLLTRKEGGLIVELTDGYDLESRHPVCGIYYDLVKTSVIRAAYIMSLDLEKFGCASVAVTPGYMRSEAMLDNYGLTEENWQEGIPKYDGWEGSETPFFVGRAVAALAADSNIMAKSGKVFSAGYLSKEYGFTDVDGRIGTCYTGGGEFLEGGFRKFE